MWARSSGAVCWSARLASDCLPCRHSPKYASGAIPRRHGPAPSLSFSNTVVTEGKHMQRGWSTSQGVSSRSALGPSRPPEIHLGNTDEHPSERARRLEVVRDSYMVKKLSLKLPKSRAQAKLRGFIFTKRCVAAPECSGGMVKARKGTIVDLENES
jgi:hypothetical protein